MLPAAVEGTSPQNRFEQLRFLLLLLLILSRNGF
jgi:hypothetical protein